MRPPLTCGDPGLNGSAVIIDAQSALQGGLDAFPRGGAWTIWYFGKKYDNFLQIQVLMPDGWTCAEVGKALDGAAERLAVGVANIENTQLQPDADRIWWDASDLADRGPYVTHLLEGAAQSLVIDEAIRTGGLNIFVIEDAGYARHLCHAKIQQGIDVGWRRPSGRLGVMSRIYNGAVFTRQVFLSVRAVLSGSRYMLRSLHAIRKGRKMAPLAIDKLKQCDVILTIWGGREVFPETGQLQRERYFGRLPSLLREQGYTVGYLVCTTVGDGPPEQGVENMLQGQDPIISVEDCLSAANILMAAFGALLSPWRIKVDVDVEGVALRPVLRFERQRETQTWRPMQSRLFRHVGEKLAEYNIRPPVVLHLYENQPWEKILRAGLRRALPETKIVGYQHVPLAPYFINTYPSAREIDQDLIPDHILVPGERFRTFLNDWGMPNERVSVGGGLRFEAMHSHDGGAAHVSVIEGNGKKTVQTILCCSSIDFYESFELVYKAAVVLSQVRNIRIIVNFHPAFDDISRERLKALVVKFAKWNLSNLVYSEDRVHELLTQADLVAYNTSSSAYDALAVKCPVLCILPDTALDYDRVPAGLSFRMRHVDELIDFVRSFVKGEVCPPLFETLSEAISTIDIGAFEAVIPKTSRN